MKRVFRTAFEAIILVAGLALGGSALPAQQVPPSLYSQLKWRLIGPFRGGRVTCVTGVSGNTAVYYAGTPGGGLWKTEDGGQLWKPVFDDANVASVGAVAVAPTNARIVYVGTGEQTPGNGMWKSTDAGTSWKHIGLEKTHFISTVRVDPRNPDTVFVASLGDRTSGDQRGVFKSTDGGATWKKVLYRDELSGVIDLTFASDAPSILFAAFQRRGPGGGRGGAQPAPVQEIYKSTDSGETWQPLNETGLPSSGLGRIGVVVAQGTSGQRVYAIVDQGFFRSDDSGATWTRMTTDPRVTSSGYFGQVFVNPRNPDDVFIGQTSMYRSTDGGKNWIAFNGAPSGDDFHSIWVNPENSQYMIQGVDQGAIISEDGGKTWSSWYNQPTGQLYHLTTDNQFPYMVYASQQDSGTVGIPSRSSFGEISDAERISIGGFEAAYIAVDPQHPNYVYSNSWYGSVVRFDRVTGQIPTVFIRSAKYREASMAPLVYSPQDPHTLYLGTQYVLKTTDGGMSWKEISPDLMAVPPPAGATPTPAATGGGRGGRGGAINTLAVSTVRAGVIWSGATNGRIQVTQDEGASWKDVTPEKLFPARAANQPGPLGSVQIIDASHFDANTAFAAVTAGQEPAPYIFRTTDGGANWQNITNGLPADAMVRFVRGDTERRGLLFAGTETSVWVSFDNGDYWQSLQLNLPVTSMRDLVVQGDDLVLATYGRSLYILDDITPLRQADGRTADSDAALFKPANAVRTRWDVYQDTPPPREVAAGPNPPDGAIFDYFLKSAPSGDYSLDIFDAKGNLVRHYSTTALAMPIKPPNVPEYWFAPPAVLPKTAGVTRFVWDLRYPDPEALPYGYFGGFLDYVEYTLADHAIAGETPRIQPQGPIAVPGHYSAVLNVGGKKYTQPFVVTMDPRVPASQIDLEIQLAWAQKATRGMAVSKESFEHLADLRAAMEDRQKLIAASAGQANDLANSVKALADEVAALQGGSQQNPTAPAIGPINRDLSRIYWMIESGDSAPSETAKASVQEFCDSLDKALDSWREINTTKLPALNSQLEAGHLTPLPLSSKIPSTPACGK
jgi:photosystem II stability/assembly factor-like uncharacterized protein